MREIDLQDIELVATWNNSFWLDENFRLEAEEQPADTEPAHGATKGIDFYALVGIYCIEILCGLAFSIYRMANKAHAGDNDFGRATWVRAIVVFGIFIWVLPVIWVPIDILLSEHSSIARSWNRLILYVIVTM